VNENDNEMKISEAVSWTTRIRPAEEKEVKEEENDGRDKI
jgi:hypothetical protein